jgi:hypothetical protein
MTVIDARSRFRDPTHEPRLRPRFESAKLWQKPPVKFGTGSVVLLQHGCNTVSSCFAIVRVFDMISGYTIRLDQASDVVMLAACMHAMKLKNRSIVRRCGDESALMVAANRRGA